MARFDDRKSLAAKIEWEGGLWDALEYGIKATDMPEGDTELTEAWTALEAIHKQFGRADLAVSKLLDLD